MGSVCTCDWYPFVMGPENEISQLPSTRWLEDNTAILVSILCRVTHSRRGGRFNDS